MKLMKQNLEKIHFHGKRADSIVKGMLQHSRSSVAEKQPTDINKMVEEFFNLAYHGMRAQDPGFNCTMEKNLAKDFEVSDFNVNTKGLYECLEEYVKANFYLDDNGNMSFRGHDLYETIGGVRI